ncbi:MAG: c-type cytochrome [Campylobacterales bacterium]|nr:c-type cytochrome [Campylobacterales bacterium]
MNWLDDSVNALSLLGAVVIIILTVLVVGKYVKQIKDDRATGELAPDNWDGIGEYKNELPVGWALAFLGTCVWAVWYWVAGYPVWAYSQIGEWNEEVAAHNAKFESTWSNANKDTLKAMGESVYLVQCAPCHGETADGMNGKAQNLNTWGKEEHIASTIIHGAKGMNYPLGEMPANLLDAESAKAVAAYVMAEMSPNKKTKYPELVETGKSLYATCAGCHGEDGKGMGGMAPDLHALVQGALNQGKKGNIGIMPSFKGRLSDIQMNALNEYIYSLQ